jgi:hypothetical protein
MVEYKRFGWKEDGEGRREGGRQGRRINMRAAILESRGDGDGGEQKTAPLHPKALNENQRSGSLKR